MLKNEVYSLAQRTKEMEIIVERERENEKNPCLTACLTESESVNLVIKIRVTIEWKLVRNTRLIFLSCLSFYTFVICFRSGEISKRVEQHSKEIKAEIFSYYFWICK